ncbi:DUF1467 family protein [Sphingomonas sp.]|uniref:DUF1467 family protein n=1 Tax=Sphingomonas sp. TaxID=28214 RepID=UPI001B1D5CF6|nr:DUF1467 family protein [Sphingomonas sp.]MBO9712071.1 DUF1467 family protein [Sphingomonas sp.]
MNWKSAIAIYVLIWALSLFTVLPFGVRTAQEAGAELVPGQAESAPHQFDARRIAIRTTIVSGVIFALFLLNYVEGWVTVDMVNRWFHG